MVGACVLLAACGGGSDDSDGAAETGATPPATTVAETTTSTTSTSTTSTTTTTSTLAPTTTSSPEQLSIAEAEQALVKAINALTDASVDPSNPDLRAEIDRYWTEPSRSAVLAGLDQLVADGARLRLSHDPVSSVQVIGNSALDSPGRVKLTYCRIDSDVIVLDEPVGGVEVVIDDNVFTRLWRGVVLNVDDEWRFSGADIVAEADGEVSCDDMR